MLRGSMTWLSLVLPVLLGISCVSDFDRPVDTLECGNGELEFPEECDDGNAADGDGCSVECDVEPGWECDGDPSVCVTTCGNGALDYPEECDDGNSVAGDGCSAACDVEPAWACDGEPSVCVSTCGNGMAEGEESCDWPDLRGADCATRSDFASGQLLCNADCLGFDTSGCYTCGDELLQGPEVCDGSDLGGAVCATTAGLESGQLVCNADCLGFETADCHTCGDGQVQGPEICDGEIFDPMEHSCSNFPEYNTGQIACSADCMSLDTSDCSFDCDSEWDCNSCAECARDSLCQAEASACYSNADCVLIIDCFNITCQPYTSACQESCEQANPGGALAFQEYLSCVYCDHCPSTCAGSVFCAP